MDNRFTTENTGHYAGRWYDLPDGKPRYFTLEEVAKQQRLYAKGSDTGDAIQKTRDGMNHAPVGIQINANGSPWQRTTQEIKVCAAEGCEKEFTPRNPNQVTCGSARCRERNRKAKRTTYNREYEARRKDRVA